MSKKKKIIISAIIGVIILIIMALFLFPQVKFELNGEASIQTNYGDEYQELGVNVQLYGIDVSRWATTEGNVDTSKLGDYQIDYSFSFGTYKKTITREIKVVDLEAPIISGSYNSVVYILQAGKVSYPNFVAEDNVDGDVSDTITIEKFDSGQIRMHFVKVTAEDKSGNVGTFIQPIGVYEDFDEVKKSSLPKQLTSGIYYMNVVNDMLYVEGFHEYSNDVSSVTHLLRWNSDSTVVEMPLESVACNNNGYFSGELDVGSLDNGTYSLTASFQEDPSIDEKMVERYIQKVARLGRWHIKDKLITFNYDDGIAITVEDFKYEYDIAIDVGHGGDDVGATGLGKYERDINLMVSLYEKERYEAHGLKVWLIREDKDYPNLLGEDDWVTLQKVAYTVGWYGAVSKYTYSNHHNSDEWGVYSGFEIIVLPEESKEDLKVEYTIFDAFKKVYQKMTNDYQFYSRSYNTGKRLDRSDGTSYPNERVFYANMRYPWECFGVKVTTYEGVYINNSYDYNWYITQKNWKKVSEAKIKAYVESLGITYIAP